MHKISVLMSVYYKESSRNLDQCLESITNQTLPADEIVIVKDGVLPLELEETLLSWHDKLPLKIVGYEENRGLPYALNYGLAYCSHELVARMDSDDICLPDRFEKQVIFFEKNQSTVLLSGYISEFNKTPNDILSIRKVPIGCENIARYLKKRNAFNHMAVMSRKSVLLLVGGYKKFIGFEDYDLWIRLVRAGYKVDNIPEILVYVRIGDNMIMRRNGFKYVKREITFFNEQRRTHFISLVEFITLFLLRVPIHLLHPKILAVLYYHFLRRQ
jgi:glycosyltransferase involved in cell wall biosynthesis